MRGIGERAGVTVTKVPKIRCDRRGGLRGVGERHRQRGQSLERRGTEIGDGDHRPDVGAVPRLEGVKELRACRAGIQAAGCAQTHLVETERIIVTVCKVRLLP